MSRTTAIRLCRLDACCAASMRISTPFCSARRLFLHDADGRFTLLGARALEAVRARRPRSCRGATAPPRDVAADATRARPADLDRRRQRSGSTATPSRSRTAGGRRAPPARPRLRHRRRDRGRRRARPRDRRRDAGLPAAVPSAIRAAAGRALPDRRVQRRPGARGRRDLARGGERPQLLGVGDGVAPQLARRRDLVGAHPPQRRRVGVQRHRGLAPACITRWMSDAAKENDSPAAATRLDGAAAEHEPVLAHGALDDARPRPPTGRGRGSRCHGRPSSRSATRRRARRAAGARSGAGPGRAPRARTTRRAARQRVHERQELSLVEVAARRPLGEAVRHEHH